MMKNIDATLFSAFSKIKGNDILDSILADCENEGNISMDNVVNIKKRKPIIAYIGSAAAALALIVCAALAVGIIGSDFKIGTEGSDISARVFLDVNPSVEIAVNNLEKVIDVKAGNDDGESIIKGLDFKGGSLDDTVTALVNRMVDENYISESQSSVLLSVTAENEEFGQDIEKKTSEGIYELLSSKKINAAVLSQTISADDELTKLAKMYNISVGRSKMIKDIIDAENRYTFEELASMSVNDLSLIRQCIGSDNVGISITGQVYTYFITVEQAIEAALGDISRSDVSDIKVMLRPGKGVYHVTYTLASDEKCSCYVHAVTGKIVDSDSREIVSECPIVSREYAEKKAIEYICDFDGVSAEQLKIIDCIVTYGSTGLPRQYVTIDSLADKNVTYYAYVYDESIKVSSWGNVSGGRLDENNESSELTLNEALSIVLEKSGREYSDLGNHFEVAFGSAQYYRFYFVTDDWNVLWFVNKDTKELFCSSGVCTIVKYGGDGTKDEIIQYAIASMSGMPYYFDANNTQAVSFEKTVEPDGVKYCVILRDNTSGRESNTALVKVAITDKEGPDLRTDDEVLEIISDGLGISKGEFKDVSIKDDEDYRAHVYFTVGDTDYWCVAQRSVYGITRIEGMAKKLHGESEFPIISEDEAIANALKPIGAKSVDDVVSCEVKYDGGKKEYTVSIIQYGSKYGKNVFWEFYLDAYTGIQLGRKFDDKGDYGSPDIKLLTEQEAIDIALKYLEGYGYHKEDMKVSVEVEEAEREYPTPRYKITCISNVTVFTTWIAAGENIPANFERDIDFEAVKLTKTGKYISEEIAEEIAVCGMKDFYTEKSVTLDESGDLAVYEVTIGRSEFRRTYIISAESGMIISIKR